MRKKLRSGRKEYCVQDVKNYAHHSGTKCHINKCMAKDKMVLDLYWQLSITRRRCLERVQLLEHALQILCTILCVTTSVFSTFVNYLNKHNHMCINIHTRPPHLYTHIHTRPPHLYTHIYTRPPHVHTYPHKTTTSVHTIYTSVLNYNVAVFLRFFY
jgi:hypothetical protein